MRDDYYEDIAYDDADDEWFDDEETWEEPLEEPAEERGDENEEHDVGGRGRRDRDQNTRGERRNKARQIDRAAGKEARKPAAAGQTSPMTDLLLLLFKVGLIAVFLLILTTFFFGITQARDESMDPAVKEGDIVVYYRLDKDYSAGDAIVMEYNGTLQVRRVVAVAGDTVDISSDGGLIINGATQIESDIYTETLPYTDGITFPVTVGTGEVFALGDNRTSAEDSRMYGTVSLSATKGAVMTVIRRRGF